MNETTEKIKRPTSITVICVNSQKARAYVDSLLITNIPSKKNIEEAIKQWIRQSISLYLNKLHILLNRLQIKNNISNFVEDAIKHYMKHAGKINLREQIKQGALKRAERDLKFTQEWNRLSNLSKAFLDKDGNAVIETGLGFKGDVT